MSKLESLEKLRKYELFDRGIQVSAYMPSDELADEIQAEVDERYMLLPVDADGVPIRLGDTVKREESKEPFKVEGFTSEFPNGEGRLLLVDELDDCIYPETVHHVKQRTVEDVLRDLLNDHFKWDGINDYDLAEAEYNDKKIRRYAAELRELYGINDAPPMGTFQVSHDCGSTFSPLVKIQSEQDSREKFGGEKRC